MIRRLSAPRKRAALSALIVCCLTMWQSCASNSGAPRRSDDIPPSHLGPPNGPTNLDGGTAAATSSSATPPSTATNGDEATTTKNMSAEGASKPVNSNLGPLTPSDALGRVTDSCASPRKNNDRLALLIKQWHPAPSVNTVAPVTGRERDLLKNIPQAENQIAIYNMLEGWVSRGLLRHVLVEGCGQGIGRGFETRFNGWNLRGLERRATLPDYASVITHVGLKLEAKLGPVVDTICADNDELIKAHSLAFSDARGVNGFLGRLSGANSDDPIARSYLTSVIDIYRLPPSTTIEQAIAQLKTEMNEVIGRIQRGFEERNKVMVRRILDTPARPMALVVGGAHAPDLKARLEKEGVACAIIEPKGYRSEDDALLEQLARWKTP